MKFSFVSDIYFANNIEVTHRYYSDGRRPGFFSNIVENLKSEYSKSKEMQDSLKKFREEAQKLEESEALKEARRKFESIEGETSKGSNVIKEQISGIADKVKGVKEKLDDVEALKKASEIGNLFESLLRCLIMISNICYHHIINRYHLCYSW